MSMSSFSAASQTARRRFLATAATVPVTGSSSSCSMPIATSARTRTRTRTASLVGVGAASVALLTATWMASLSSSSDTSDGNALDEEPPSLASSKSDSNSNTATEPYRSSSVSSRLNHRVQQHKTSDFFHGAAAAHQLPPPPLKVGSICNCDSAAESVPIVGSSSTDNNNKNHRRRPSERTNKVEYRHRKQTLRKMDSAATKHSLSSLYEVEDVPLGEGSFGEVFAARDKRSGERLALKKISKTHTDEVEFQREMNVLLHVRACGGHPNICMLRENFEETDCFILILDLIRGGEMFDALIANGAYSEADAARLTREVASALNFLHGIGVVHADLKPENLMLSSKNNLQATIKLVDFGCAEVLPEEWSDGPPLDGGDETNNHVQKILLTPTRTIAQGKISGTTPAYCPPESLSKEGALIRPAMDMWSLGVILYIMLTGLHPFDLQGILTDNEIEEEIKTVRRPPLEGSPVTAHLSASAIDLLSKLMSTDPKKRLTAREMLEHPWVKGDTARQDVMAGSDHRLSKFRRFRSQIEAKVFADLVKWSDNVGRLSPSERGTSLIEKAFGHFDKENKGSITLEDVEAAAGQSFLPESSATKKWDDAGGTHSALSLSEFSDLLGENLQTKYFPRGHVVFHEGDLGGDYMYFINSGTAQVTTSEGFRTNLGQGDSFGEGSLLRPGDRRTATIRCTTPVHVIRVDHAYFQKYLASAETELALQMREKVNTRKFGRAEFIIRQSSNVVEDNLDRGDCIFETGDDADALYIVEQGEVDVRAKSKTVYTLRAGDMFGVQSLLMNRPRKACAFCVSDHCKLKRMDVRDFNVLLRSSPKVEQSLHELALRREFKRAVVLKTQRSFPDNNVDDGLQNAFDQIDIDGSGNIDLHKLREVLQHLDESISDGEILELIQSMDLTRSGTINFKEFQSIFGRN